MKLVKFRISKILNKEKFSYKYFDGFNFSQSKEKTGTEWELAIEGDNGNKYLIRLRDGRKANQFYEGKEIFGMERPNPAIMRTEKFDRSEFKGLEDYRWTKEKFESVLEQHIQRTREFIKNEDKELERLLKLKETSPEIS